MYRSYNKLRLFRTRNRYSQQELGRLTRVPVSSIQRCEQFGLIPRELYQEALAKFFKVSIKEIFPEKESA